MAAELIISADAERDLSEAYSWYEAQREGLGEDFLTCVDACIEGICGSPLMNAIVHDDYRRGLVRRFPYAVFYDYRDGW